MKNVIPLCLALGIAACSTQTVDDPEADGREESDLDGALRRKPGTYLGACDGSGAIAIGYKHFLDVNDENQGARIYKRGKKGSPIQQFDLSKALDLKKKSEGDLEGVARIENRLFVIASHGRNKDGELRPERARFGAVDLEGDLPNITATNVGSTSTLLVELLNPANWETPNLEVIAALEASSQLSVPADPALAPEAQGLNIEGLASTPEGQLVIGFRNPRPSDAALVVTLTNPNEVVTGQTARFGAAGKLDLGGLGIRGMTWSDEHGAMLLIAGSHSGSGPFRLYKWSGALDAAPTLLVTLEPPPNSSPEAVVSYPGSKDVQIIYDQGDAFVDGINCKDLPDESRRFSDVIVDLD